MKQFQFTPRFVDTIPEILEPGNLYISKRFRTASHLCACGCGSRVVTPLKPTKWELTEKQGRVSLWPSIGRWQLPCKSHYYITDNKVDWRGSISEAEMRAVQEQDARDLHSYYASRKGKRGLRGIWSRFLRWISRK